VEGVCFFYAVLVFCCAVVVWSFHFFVELGVSFGCGFCCFGVYEVEEAFFEDVGDVFCFYGFYGLHFAVEDFHGFGEFSSDGVCCVYVDVSCNADYEDGFFCFADGKC